METVYISELGTDSATVAEITVKVGDTVAQGDTIAIIETDKATVDLEATASGVIKTINFADGAEIKDNDAFLVISTEESTAADTSNTADSIDSSDNKDTSNANNATTTISADYKQLIGDLGDSSADVAEIVVAVGDVVAAGDVLAILETDKASAEFEAEVAGTVAEILVAENTTVNTGDLFAVIKTVATANNVELATAENTVSEQYFYVPGTGSDDGADLVELSIKVGDSVKNGDVIGLVETDKASSELEIDFDGVVKAVLVKTGDKLQTDQKFALFEVTTANTEAVAKTPTASQPKTVITPTQPTAIPQQNAIAAKPSSEVYAGPAVRFLARKLGVDLGFVVATGPRGRILADDLHLYVRQRLQAGAATPVAGNSLPERAKTDFSKFGDFSVKPLTKIQKVTIATMMKSWLNVPMVTQFDDIDITELEQFRKSLKPEMAKRDIKITPVAFLIKSAAMALEKHPNFNSSVDDKLENLITRNYINIGVAVATANGLLVPVIKDANKLDIWQIGQKLTELSLKARDGKLTVKEMSGSCFTISSLGAIGGTGFTPIVNTPEAAILGVSKSKIAPVWDGEKFIPRNLLPVALTYDHNAINGADAGTFLVDYIKGLQDINDYS